MHQRPSDAGGWAVPGVTFEWTSSDLGVATVVDGVVTAVAGATAMIRATEPGGVYGEATVTVDQEVASVTVTPASATLSSLGATTTLTAVASDAGGWAVPGVKFEWTTSDEGVATVVDGVVTAVRTESGELISTTAQSGRPREGRPPARCDRVDFSGRSPR